MVAFVLMFASGAVRGEIANQPAPAAAPLHAVLAIEGKQVALPDGTWAWAGQAVHPGGAMSVALLRERAGKIDGGMLIQVNRAGASSAWGVPRSCERRDLPFAKVRYVSDHDGSCAFVARVGEAVDDPTADPAWRAAQRTAVIHDWKLPAQWAVAGVHVTDAREAVQLYYAFPVPAGPSGLPSRAVPSLVAWTLAAWDSAERGLLNQLDPAKPLPSWSQETVLAAPPAMANLTDNGGVMHLVFWKTITFRTVATTLDFTGNAIATGNLLTAALLSTWNTLTGPWIYAAHELAWEYYGTPRPAIMQLPALGTEQP